MGVAKNLSAAWRVRVEESLGPNSSPLEHIAGMLLLRSLVTSLVSVYMY